MQSVRAGAQSIRTIGRRAPSVLRNRFLARGLSHGGPARLQGVAALV